MKIFYLLCLLFPSFASANHTQASSYAHWNGKTFVYQVPSYQTPSAPGGPWSKTTYDVRDPILPDFPADTKDKNPWFYEGKVKEKMIRDARNRGEEVFWGEEQLMHMELDEKWLGDRAYPKRVNGKEDWIRTKEKLKQQKEEWFKTTQTYQRQQQQARETARQVANAERARLDIPYYDPCGCGTCVGAHNRMGKKHIEIRQKRFDENFQRYGDPVAAHLAACESDKIYALLRIPSNQLTVEARDYIDHTIRNSDRSYREIQDLNLPLNAKKPFLDYALDTLQNSFDFIDGLRKGTLQGFQNHAATLKDAVDHIRNNPASIARFGEALMQRLGHPEQIKEAIVDAYTRVITVATYGSAFELGEVVGEFAAQTLIGAAEVAALGPIAPAAQETLIASLGGRNALSSLGESFVKRMETLPNYGPPLTVILDQIRAKEAAINFQGWKTHYHLIQIESADSINVKVIAEGWHPPYQYGTQVPLIQSTQVEQFARVFVYEKGTEHLGSWLMKKEAIEGMTPDQIRVKYALPKIPTHICDVSVPAESQMYRGKVGDILHHFKDPMIPPGVHTPEGAIQYQLKQRIDASNYANIRPIGERVQ